MKYTYRLTLLLIVCFTILAGCKKSLDVGNPPTQIAAASAFATNNSAFSVMAGVYVEFRNAGFAQGGNSFSVNCGKAADEFSYPSDDPYFRNAALGDEFWPQLYKSIYNANRIIEGLEATQAGILSATVKKQLTAEAKFIRAFCYFYLVNLYGEVPLLTSTSYLENASLPRVATNLVYEQIVKDLAEAKEALNEQFVRWDGETVSEERTRPNKISAAAMLARAYLYMGDYASAAAEAQSVVNAGNQYQLYTDLDSVFLKNSREALWQIQPADPDFYSPNTGDAGSFLRENMGQTFGSIWLSDDLLNSFEPDDQRRVKWVGQGTDTLPDRYPYKYKLMCCQPQQEYLMALRLAEQYLILAEALAQQNLVAEGLEYLNVVRRRAGLADIAVSGKDGLLDAIMHERRVELFSEWGHRWFDLKRTGKIDVVMSQAAAIKGTTWASYKALFCIPEGDIRTNANLVQNPGY